MTGGRAGATRSARRRAALAVVALAVMIVAASCGTDGSTSTGTTNPTSATTAVGTTGTVRPSANLAGTMVFGSGSECPNEPYCLPGLRDTYGLVFERFVVTDSGGPLTIAALQDGSIGAGILFTTNPNVAPDHLVLLEDDRHLQPAENVTPIVNETLTTTYGTSLATTIDAVSAALTTERLTDLNRQVEIDGATAAEAATGFLQEQGLQGSATPAARSGPTIVVGSANFSESSVLAELYAQALTGAGFPVERRLDIGSRKTYFPLVQNGEVGLFPEYAGSLLGYLEPDATESSDTAAAHQALVEALAGSGLVALAAAPAEDKNAVAVTQATADRLSLRTVSDLARPS